jgi:hypothetical protein
VITGPVIELLSVREQTSSCTSAHSGESLESVGWGDGMRFAKSIEDCGNGNQTCKIELFRGLTETDHLSSIKVYVVDVQASFMIQVTYIIGVIAPRKGEGG